MVDHAPRYPSHDPDIERYEDEPANHPVAPYEAGRSARANYSHPPVPLFLSDRHGTPDPSEYMSSLMKGQGSYYVSRILVGAMGGVVIALVAALASSDSAREFMASAKASSVAALSVASVAMQPGSAPAKVAALPPRESPPPSAAAENGPAAAESEVTASAASGTVAVAAVTPTRDDIKAAYQGAAQGSMPQTAAVPEQAAPVDIIRHLDAGEIASLLKRADTLIGSGDLAAARLVLRRAAEAGDARAAMMLGGTYDPAVLEKLRVRGVVPDMATARSWYEKAKRFGATDATPTADLLAKKQD